MRAAARAVVGGESVAGAEVALWRAVVAQAISDARQPRYSLDREQARTWLTDGARDFRLICHLAQLEHQAVQEAALKLKGLGWPPIPVGETRNIRQPHRRKALA